MRARFVCLVVAVIAAGAGASAVLPATGEIVLGSKAFALNGEGWGTARPAGVFNGGDPSGLIRGIHWTAWGGAVAHGAGRTYIFRPAGGYYDRAVPIELRATKVGRCKAGGPRAYLRLTVRRPSRPGGPLGKWELWSGQPSLCRWA